MYTLDKPSHQEYPVLLEIWEASVRATHHFLSEQDIAFYKQLIQEYQVFHKVDITIVRNQDGEILGFMGVADEKLEMIFLKPAARGKGIGKMLLKHAVEALRVSKVDVNEQNEQAVKFYNHLGFKVIGRSELDDQGKPYPILRLQLM
jgi:putative acetyltransferase